MRVEGILVMVTGQQQIQLVAEGLVTSNPGILGGCPVFTGTRVPVSAFFEYLADGLSVDYSIESFPTVSREQATEVLKIGSPSRILTTREVELLKPHPHTKASKPEKKK